MEVGGKEKQQRKMREKQHWEYSLQWAKGFGDKTAGEKGLRDSPISQTLLWETLLCVVWK